MNHQRFFSVDAFDRGGIYHSFRSFRSFRLKMGSLALAGLLFFIIARCDEKNQESPGSGEAFSSSIEQIQEHRIPNSERVKIVTSIPPVAMILRPIVGRRARVATVVPPGFSPRIFEIPPPARKQLENAHLLFVVSRMLDGSLQGISTVSLRVELLELLPQESRLEAYQDHSDHDGVYDPHFWLDPIRVNAVAEPLVERLCAIDPGGCEQYTENGQQFVASNRQLHKQIQEILDGHEGKSAVFHHPSFRYFMDRYGIEAAAYMEPYPGKESGPAHMASVIRQARAEGARAIFTEPQLSDRPATMLHKELGIPVITLDPLGGQANRFSYNQFLLYNARQLGRGLEAEPADNE